MEIPSNCYDKVLFPQLNQRTKLPIPTQLDKRYPVSSVVHPLQQLWQLAFSTNEWNKKNVSNQAVRQTLTE